MLELLTVPDTAAHAPTALQNASEWAKTAGAYSATVLLGVGLFRVALRPFVDTSRFESWKRKRAEVEAYLRDEIFTRDFADRAAVKVLAEQSIQMNASNAQAIANLTNEITRVFQSQSAQTTLLGSIPHLAGTVEQMSESIDALRTDVRSAIDIARENGATIAAHSALLGVMPEDERRHIVRRISDPQPADRS